MQPHARTPVRRPETARPRRDRPAEVPAPPTQAELEAIERGLVGLAALAGASVAEMPELGVRLASCPGRGPAFDFAACVRWTEHDWQARAMALAAHARARGEHPALLLAEGLTRPPDLATRLVEADWTPSGGETVMLARRAGVVPHLDPSLRIEAVTERSAAEHEAVERSIFGLAGADAGDRLAALRAGIAAGRLRAYLVRLAGQPVAVARLAVGLEGLAALHGVGVVASRRRQGYGSLVTTVATRAGLAQGHPLVWLSVDAANAAATALYEGLDYRPAFRWRRLLGPAA
ncbi:MAG TPA: GNAT family N-acetyltransferase [Candidatus Limnocylindrales bacterium]|nr:GNAT family N-acetyltransferase [Candidatus Limnocylindrales bacterium]